MSKTAKVLANNFACPNVGMMGKDIASFSYQKHTAAFTVTYLTMKGLTDKVEVYGQAEEVCMPFP